DRYIARKQIISELDSIGLLTKIEDYKHTVPFSDRGKVPIEPLLSTQWFLKMDSISRECLEKNNLEKPNFIPKRWQKVYKDWLVNINDWCISRQLWWGHQIPAYFYGDDKDDFVVAITKEEALLKAKEKSGRNISADELIQDEDVMDTWFSSWIWPIAVFDGFSDGDKKELDYYYPTNDLVTAPEIMFFWVARMIISGYEYKNNPPFKNVYYTGIVRDKLGRKMSKSLGNSPDPLELIKKFGADGVRVGMLLSSPAGNDLLFDSNLCEQGRNFTNKIWNAFRLINSWTVNEDLDQLESSKVAVKWMTEKFYFNLENINQSYDKFRISEALMGTYKSVWDDFCSLFLEMVKPSYGHPIDAKTFNEVKELFDLILKLIHPFTPFIAEEIWQQLYKRNSNEFIVNAQWPRKPMSLKSFYQNDFNEFQLVITELRNLRNQKSIANKVAVELKIKKNVNRSKNFESVLIKLGNISSLEYVSKPVSGAYSFVVNSNEFFIPFNDEIDIDAELDKIQNEIEDRKGFLSSVMNKINNEKFMANAPQKVVEMELKKKSDAESQIKVLESKLASLKT
ncbi:MAG: valine--tRNA ligase, partial [Crocinitomicaceae bacterium]|nr:valine--tRNA ligase [Crocinitomicaceae bacterium]